MKLFFNYSIITILLATILSCTTEIEEPEIDLEPEVIVPEIKKPVCNPKDVCCFDLSDQPGEFNLVSKWEFAGYQESKESLLDNLTCLARWAEFSLGGEDYDKITQVTLLLSDKMSSMPNCKDLPQFFFKSFNIAINGCYQTSGTNEINLHFSPEDVILTPSNNFTALPMVDFEQMIEKDLSNIEKYEIDNNKLYLQIKEKSEKMVFLAIEE